MSGDEGKKGPETQAFAMDTEKLNATPNWETWLQESGEVCTKLREAGFSKEVAEWLEGEMHGSAEHDDAVEIYVYPDVAHETPTTPTGYGNYYYWKRVGNAYVDATSKETANPVTNETEYVTEIKIVPATPLAKGSGKRR